jgi:hypothetical protein
MRSLAKSGAEKTMKMKFGEARLARRLFEQNTGLIFRGEQIASATEPPEGVVVEKLRHVEMILRVPLESTGVDTRVKDMTENANRARAIGTVIGIVILVIALLWKRLSR